MKRRSWSAAKEAFVARRRLGVVPGVKMPFQSSSRKDAMLVIVGHGKGRECCDE